MKKVKATMQDVAERAGVSKTTVSMVLNNKDNNISEATKERILRIADEMNYIPNSIARSLSTKKSGTIGIMIPDITNPFFSEISRAIEDAANSFDYNVIFCNLDNDIEKEFNYTKLLVSKLVDGVIFITGGNNDKSIQVLEDNNVPFVFVDRYIKGYEHYNGVYSLNKDGVIEGVEYLYKKNKRKIVFVTGDMELGISKFRYEGYKEAMGKYGLFDDKLVFESDFSLKGGKEITQQIIDEVKDLDTIFYSNDLMALGGMMMLYSMGYNIPKDIAVVGFDNIQISEATQPPLTTIGQPIYEMGKCSCELLINLINKQDHKPKIINFKPKLIIRETV